MVAGTVYKRGQVEWALWRFFSLCGPKAPKPPQVFLTRIKRLLEVDWMRDTSQDSEVPHPRFAFRDERGKGKGRDTSYSLFNGCCLAFGLELLDVGFKQSEIVFLLRHLRDQLEREFQHILNIRPAPRQPIPAEDRPDCPVYEDEKGWKWADCRVYAIIHKVEFKELFPLMKDRKPRRQPVFPTPVFCHGYAAAAAELHKMNLHKFHYRKAFVMELAYMVVLVKQFLEEAPAVLRGRK